MLHEDQNRIIWESDFAETIKMVHFSNADNLITEAMEKHEDGGNDFWN